MFVIYIGVLNFFPFLMNVANVNVANAPLREAKGLSLYIKQALGSVGLGTDD